MEHGVGNGQAVCGTGHEQKEAVTVALPYSLVSNDSFPNLVVLTYACVEVTEEYELVRLWNSGDEGFQFFIELFLDFVWVGHGWSVGADKGSGSEILCDFPTFASCWRSQLVAYNCEHSASFCRAADHCLIFTKIWKIHLLFSTIVTQTGVEH